MTTTDENLDANGDLAPPWARYPDYTRYTIGWRMGPGEGWMWMWHDWTETLAQEARPAYLHRHPRAPWTWSDFVYRFLHPDRDEESSEQAQREAMIYAGFLAKDAAYKNWCAALDGPPDIPSWHDSPSIAARYSTRELTFWCRWMTEQRSAGLELPRPSKKPPRVWRPLVNTALTGELAAKRLPPLKKGWRRLAFELALRGSATVPWVLEISAESWGDSYDEDADYADAWLFWASTVFEDAPTWRAMLAQWPEPPEGWRRLLETELFIPDVEIVESGG